jgi:hypothetical protein
MIDNVYAGMLVYSSDDKKIMDNVFSQTKAQLGYPK